jgi:hypothetical protein
MESISILVFDLQKDRENPHAVLTGDTILEMEQGDPDGYFLARAIART